MSYTHGNSGYVLGCRCDTCKTGNRAYRQNREAMLKARGLCRYCLQRFEGSGIACESCLAENRVYFRAWKANRRAQARTEAA